MKLKQKITRREGNMFENLLTTETLTQLKSITVLGNRDELNQTNLVSILLILLDATRVEYQPECIATALQLLSQLLDNNQLTSETATNACKHAVHSMKSFPEDREVLSNGAAVIWICAANFTTECLGEGAYQALEQASKMKKHFANLEVGNRHPFRFKLGIIGAALSRLTET